MSKQLLTKLLEPLQLPSETHQKVAELINEALLHHSQDWAAHMTPHVDMAGIVGKAVAAFHNGNLLSPDLYPRLKQAEQEIINWLISKFGFKFAYMTAGSSYGNLEALWQARDTNQHSKLVFGSSECHYSIPKACEILGLTFVAIDTDALGRISPAALEQQCEQQQPAAIVLNVGTTSNGEIDPIDACIDISKRFNAWCHIDAAWGGCLAFLDSFQPLVSMLSRADSLCFDPHKALKQPKPSGIVFYQQARHSLNIDASYLIQSPQKSISGSLGGELFLPLWLSIQAYGEQYFSDDIKTRLEQANLFAEGLDEELFWRHCSSTGIVTFYSKQSHDLTPLIDSGHFSTAKVNNKHVVRAVFSTGSTKAQALLVEIKNRL
jgi:glutamate/tyrosine decarboxylase-like PLP-dependent enzyme